MAQTIKLRRSSSSGAVPTTSQLALGEVAINTYDGKVYIKKDVSGTESIVEVGAAASPTPGGSDGQIQFNNTGTLSGASFLYADDSNSRLGIGTTSPSRILHVENDGLADLLLRDTSAYSAGTGPAVIFQGNDSGSTNTQFGAIYGVSNGSNSGELSFETRNSGSSAERVRIDSSGNVGIGTSSANERLTISSGNSGSCFVQIANTDSGEGDNQGLYVGLTGGDEGYVGTRHNADLVFETNDSERMRIASSGNVGIGTTSPTYLLTLKDSNGADLAFSNSTVSPSAGDYLGRIYALDNGDNFFAGINMFYHDADDGEIRFRVKTAGTNTDVMTLVDGKVGIGTTSPTSYNSKADDLVVLTSADTGISIVSGTSSEGAIVFADGTTGGDPLRGRVRYSHSTDSMDFRVNNNEAMRIDSSRNLLVGKTAIDSSVAGFEVDSDGKIAATRDASQVAIFNRLTDDGTIVTLRKDGSTVGTIGSSGGQYLTIGNNTSGLGFIDQGSPHSIRPWNVTTNTGSDDTLDLGASTVRFKNLYLSSGLRADTLTFSTLAGTERMRIDSSGNVGIGTSSPQEKIHVASNDGLIAVQSSNSNTADAIMGGYMIYSGDGSGPGAGNRAGIASYIMDSFGVTYDLRFYTSNSSSNLNEAMRIDSSGNVLIGTDSGDAFNSDSVLRLQKSGQRVFQQFKVDSDQEVRILFGNVVDDVRCAIVYEAANDNLIFTTGNNDEALRIDSSGNVGIGNTVASTINTANGLGNLVVGSGSGSEGITIYTGTTGIGGLAFADGTTTTDTYRGYLKYDHSVNAMSLWTDATQRLIINGVGDVGIGTTTPQVKFEVQDNTTWDVANFSSTNAVGSGFTINAQDTGVEWSLIAQGTTGGANDNNLGFHLSDAGTSGQAAGYKFVMTPSGSLGIGTTSPDETLHVQNSGNPTVRIETSGASNYSSVHFADAGGASGRIEYQHSNDSMQFRTNASEAMRIDSSGNLLVGTTNVDPVSGNVTGTSIKAQGNIQASRDGGVVISGNRKTSDGIIFEARKDGTTIGGIGSSYGDRINIGTGNTGLMFRTSSRSIDPADTSTGLITDNAIDLGRSASRFKDLYLAGDVSADTATISTSATIDGNDVLTTADYDTLVCHLKTNINATVDQGVANAFDVNFNLEEHNDSTAFSHSSGVITVLSTGWYRIYANMVYQNATASARNTVRAYVSINSTEITSTATYDYDRGSSYGEFSNNKIETLLYLSANDTIAITNYAENEDGSLTIESAECEFIVNSVAVQTTTGNADTVDGLHASQFLRSDTSDSMTGDLDITGSLGVGTSSPAYTLDVSGDARFYDASGSSANYYFEADHYCGVNLTSDKDASAGGPYSTSINANGANGNLELRTNSLQRVSIDQSGNVGIGSTSPASLLHVQGSSASGIIQLGTTGGTTSREWKHIVSSSTGYYFLQDTTAGSNRIAVDTSGNVGIGTTSPVGLGGATVLQVHDSGTDYAQLRLTNSTSGSTVNQGFELNFSGTDIYINNRENGAMAFYNNGSEAMRIDSSRNLLVGTTNANPTSSGVNDPGVELSNTGGVRSTVASNPAATFNRKTDDGDLVLFRKDGSTVGRIGTSGGYTHFISGTGGIRPIDNTQLRPVNSDGTGSDGTMDLGTSGIRFKDLYLSGTATATTFSGALSGNATTATGLSATLAVSSGGTGATTLTANNVILGNGTSAVQAVAPGTSGNVLTSDGTTWTSAAPSGGSSLYGLTTSNVDGEPGRHTGLGWCAGPSTTWSFPTSYNDNVAIGTCAMLTFDTSSDQYVYYNTAVGASAMRNITSSTCYHTAIGFGASCSGGGWYSVRVGICAGRYSCSARCGVAIGMAAHYNSGNNTSTDNVFIGTCTGYCSCRCNNVAVGGRAYMGGTGFQTGFGNTAVGACAARTASSGCYNVAIGERAMYLLTTGCNNISIGNNSGQTTSTAPAAGLCQITTQSNYIQMGNSAHVCALIQIGWTTVSDCRDKTCFKDVPHGLDFVNALKPTEYQFRKSRDTEETDGVKRYGFLAQDVIALEGDSPVVTSADDPDKLKYTETHMVPILVKAIQELSAEVKRLKET